VVRFFPDVEFPKIHLEGISKASRRHLEGFPKGREGIIEENPLRSDGMRFFPNAGVFILEDCFLLLSILLLLKKSCFSLGLFLISLKFCIFAIYSCNYI